MSSKPLTPTEFAKIVCGHIHGPLTVEVCASRGCKGCTDHLAKLAEPKASPTDLDGIALVF